MRAYSTSYERRVAAGVRRPRPRRLGALRRAGDVPQPGRRERRADERRAPGGLRRLRQANISQQHTVGYVNNISALEAGDSNGDVRRRGYLSSIRWSMLAPYM